MIDLKHFSVTFVDLRQSKGVELNRIWFVMSCQHIYAICALQHSLIPVIYQLICDKFIRSFKSSVQSVRRSLRHTSVYDVISRQFTRKTSHFFVRFAINALQLVIA